MSLENANTSGFTHTLLTNVKGTAKLLLANQALAFQIKEKEKQTAALVIANKALKKAQDYQKTYILGLEKMMFMTSHKVRQPVCQIIGVSNLMHKSADLPESIKEMIGCIRNSALCLDTFTRKLTKFIGKLKLKGNK